MARKKSNNLFSDLGEAALAREESQKKIEDSVSSYWSPDRKTTMTIPIIERDKFLIKNYALRHRITVGELIHDWILDNCEEDA